MAGGAFLLVSLSVVGVLLLYTLIASETSNPRVVDRETAERHANRGPSR